MPKDIFFFAIQAIIMIFLLQDIIADASVAEADTVVQLGADGEPDNSDPSSAEVESTVTMEVSLSCLQWLEDLTMFPQSSLA